MQHPKNTEPSPLLLRLFRWFCKPEYHPDIEGDLLEMFEDRCDARGHRHAQWLLFFDILLLFRPSLIKPLSGLNPFKYPTMFKSNLKIAWRHLVKQRFVTIINLSGLIIGMTAALFIWQYVNYERSYDDFHELEDRIYRVRTDRIDDGVPFMQFAGGTAGIAPLMKKSFPEVEDYVKLYGSGEAIFAYGDNQSIRGEKVYFATASIFDVFSFPMVQGDPQTALTEPFTACLSETTARKLFGDENPVGKTITRNKTQQYKVTGVFADCPSNSHLKFNILLSYVTFSDVLTEGDASETSLTWDGFFSYLLLKPQTDWQALEAKIPDAVAANYNEGIQESVAFYLQPLEDIHLNSNYLIEAEVNGSGSTVKFLLIIGISVLLIAWFNYINLSTANSELRAKEVGVRKVLGGSPNKLVGQFLTEAALLNLFAIAVSFFLVWALHPFFESLIGEDIPRILFSDSSLLGITAGILVLGTLLSGLYPAFILSSFKPILTLKPGAVGKSSGSGKWLSRGLVTMQFIASVALIAGTMIVYRQLHFLQDTKLGLNIDQTLIVKGPKGLDSTIVQKAAVFKQQVENIGEVKKLAASTSIPGQSFGWTAGGVHRLGTPDEDSENFHVMAADVDYTQLYEMELAAGRHMSDAMVSDGSTACLLNETGVELLKFDSPEDAIGKSIEFWGEQFTIIGVLKDFYQESPKAEVEPLVLRARPANWGVDYYSVKLNTQQLTKSLAGIEASWSNIFPGNPFEYFFLDEHFNQLYESETQFSKVFTLFSGLAIFVSCLGLFALVTFMTERKRKEIGVRRVLGASVGNIVGLLSRDFIKIIAVALVIATPLAWYTMQQWLEGFANRISIPWWFFGLAGIMALGIAFLTVGFQSARAALADPVEALRNE